MSKRHASRQQRGVSGYDLRGPRYAVQLSRTTERHDNQRARTERHYWYVVLDRETGEPVGEEFSDGEHARQLADRLNEVSQKAARQKRQARPFRTLRQEVEAVLGTAGCITGGCPRHKTFPMVSIHADKEGSVVLVRPLPFAREPFPGPPLSEQEQLEYMRYRVRRGLAPLAKAGLFVTEEQDTRGLFLRVTKF